MKSVILYPRRAVGALFTFESELDPNPPECHEVLYTVLTATNPGAAFDVTYHYEVWADQDFNGSLETLEITTPPILLTIPTGTTTFPAEGPSADSVDIYTGGSPVPAQVRLYITLPDTSILELTFDDFMFPCL